MSRPTVAAVDVDSWLALGVERGWCSEPVCDSHERLPITDAEKAREDEGGDPCVYAVRLYRDD